MYLKYYLLALVKISMLLALPPYLAGLVADLVRKEKADRLAPYLGVGYVCLIELFVLIEKGEPFLFANLYFMFSLSPKVALQYLIGVGGFVLWSVFAIGFVRNGIKGARIIQRWRGGSS